MFKVLKDFTTPMHRFKSGMVIDGNQIDGPLGVDGHLAAKNIESNDQKAAKAKKPLD